ncbi:MAG: S-layer homology domain-containing protein [Clostridia bacterium]|nr:S-layer homology domain-containing protein [Clostridia bacterium]
MKNKHRNFSKRVLSFATICALIASVFAPIGAALAAPASTGIEASYVPYEVTNTPAGLHPSVKGLLTVEGHVGKAEKTSVVLMVLAKGKTEADLANNVSAFGTAVDSFRQVTTGNDGKFSVSFGIGFYEDGVSSTKGDYVVAASYGDTSVLTDGFYYSTAAHVGEALAAVNASSDAQSLKTEITVNSPKELVLDTAIYDTLGSGAKDLAIAYVFNAKQALKDENSVGFLSGEALRESFNEASLFYKLKSASTGDELKSMLNTYKAKLSLTTLPAYKTYTDSLTDSGRTAVCDSMKGLGGCTLLSDVKGLFTKQVILNAVAKAGLWSNIKPIINQNKAALISAGASESYYSLSDTSAPDKAIVGKTYQTLAALAEAINENIKTDAPPSQRPSSGSGGGSSVIPAPPVVTPVGGNDAPSASGFADMAGYEWAADAVSALKNMGVINGKSDSSFAPADNVTREEFVKMLISLLGISVNGATADFADADKGAWYYPYISAAANGGIVNGVGNGVFGVGMNITRQDIATIACRAMGITASDALVTFSDEASIADYAKDGVAALASHGIISGMGDGSFAPTANATRAQAAKILYELHRWKESGK